MPFNEANACRNAGMLLEIHETGHALFDDTSVTYWIQENFAKTLSFYVTGYYDGGEVNNDNSFIFGISACDDRMQTPAPLNYQLCKLYGLDVASYKQIFVRMDSKRAEGLDVNDHVFKSILDEVAGQDTGEAFLNANVSLVT